MKTTHVATAELLDSRHNSSTLLLIGTIQMSANGMPCMCAGLCRISLGSRQEVISDYQSIHVTHA